MKKKICVLFCICVLCVCTTACGNLSDKVTQSISTIEIGETFNIETAFDCEEGITIELKDGESLNTKQLGESSATFVISNGKNTEEKIFSFDILDTQAPKIDAQDVSLYKGEEFLSEDFAICTDNSGEEVEASVEYLDVNTSVAGTYSVTYSAADSSGNSAEQSIVVTVLPIETVEDVWDLVDQYLSKNGYTSYSYSKNKIDTVFVTAPQFEIDMIDSSRDFIVYPDIYIPKDIFGDEYRVSGIIFRFEYTDRTETVGERYGLSSEELTISSEHNTMTLGSIGMPANGEYDRYKYLSKFDYVLKTTDFSDFNDILDDGSVTFDVDTNNFLASESGVVDSYGTVHEPYEFSFELSDAGRAVLQETVKIAEHFRDVLGVYGVYEEE